MLICKDDALRPDLFENNSGRSAFGWNCRENIRNVFPYFINTLAAIICFILFTDTVSAFETKIVPPSVTGGFDYALGLSDDGTVWGWGDNEYYQITADDISVFSNAIQSDAISGLIAVETGDYHTVALKEDGTVWAWGDNEYCQLGSGYACNSSDGGTEEVDYLYDIISVSGYDTYTIALDDYGDIWGWGDDYCEIEGDGGYGGYGGDDEDLCEVEYLGSVTNAIAVAKGGSHSVALTSDGFVLTWGSNYYGQLGREGEYDVPDSVGGIDNVIAVAAGKNHTIVLKNDGTVWGWGGNYYNQISPDGNGGNGFSAPVFIIGDVENKIIAIAAGGSHSLALTEGGTVFTWGCNNYGQLGRNTAASSEGSPQPVAGLNHVADIGAGNDSSLIIKDDGTVCFFGRIAGLQSEIPVQVKTDDEEFLDLYTSLSIDIPENVDETSGTVQGTVSVSYLPENSLAIHLSSDCPDVVSVPEDLEIPAGSNSASFTMDITDNGLLDGGYSATLTASVAGDSYAERKKCRVADDETAVLTLEIPGNPVEGEGNLTGTVYVGEPVDSDVAVTLFSSGSADGIILPAEVIISEGETSSTFSFTAIDSEDFDGDKIIRITAEVAGWTSDSQVIKITEKDTEYGLTELFSNDDNDLDYKTVTFTPDNSYAGYRGCVEEADGFLSDPSGGTVLTMNDDSYQTVSLEDDKKILFYGAFYSSFYIGSNGYITFGASDTDSRESLENHYDLPRISALFDDLYPGYSHTKISWRQLTDRAVVTYQGISEKFYSNTSNSFQVEMFFDGVIRITWLEIDAKDGLAGLSDGIPAAVETDISSLACIPHISISPEIYNFEETEIGSTGSNTFEITNIGTADLEVGAPVFVGNELSEFIIQSNACEGTSLLPGESCLLKVAFTPVENGVKNVFLDIPSNALFMPSVRAELSGVGGLLPEIANVKIGSNNVSDNGKYVLFKDKTLMFGATDFSGVKSVKVMVDGDEIPVESSGDVYSCLLQYGTLSPGEHTLMLNVLDIYDHLAAKEFSIAAEEPLPFDCFDACMQ